MPDSEAKPEETPKPEDKLSRETPSATPRPTTPLAIIETPRPSRRRTIVNGIIVAVIAIALLAVAGWDMRHKSTPAKSQTTNTTSSSETTKQSNATANVQGLQLDDSKKY